MRTAAAKRSKETLDRFLCPECGKSFKTPGALGGHRAYVHKSAKTGAKPAKAPAVQFVCPECGKNFKNAGALGGHRAYIHKGWKKETEVIGGAITLPPAASSSTANGAHDHLRAARESLIGLEQQFEIELKRLAEVQADRERVRRELDAVNTALQVFGDKI